MLFNQLSSVLVCSFWVDEGKNRQSLENVEQKSSKPNRQLALKGSEGLILWKKMEKSIEKSCEEQNLLYFCSVRND